MSLPNTSYYQATRNSYPGFAPLSGRTAAHIAIIGGGYAGLNTALGLAERGVRDVALLECEQVGHGASGRNGGFVFAGYSLGEETLLCKLGGPTAKDLYTRSVGAVNLVRDRIKKYGIACDAVDAGVLWVNWFRDPNALRKRQSLLAEKYGVEWEWVAHERLQLQVHSARYSDALWERNALHMHPLNYAVGLAQAAAAKDVRIFERTPAQALMRKGAGWEIRTPDGIMEAENVVLACGGYLAGLDAGIDRSLLPIATYVMATEPLGDRLKSLLDTQAAIYDTRFAFDYYRALPDTRLLWGGRISVRDRHPASVARVLKRDLMRVFPQLHDVKIDYAWSGLMSYARHQMPQIGRHADGLWYAQAFGGHGIAPTTVAGELIAAALAHGDVSWQALQPFGLANAYKPLGYAAAQASYWWHQLRDALRT